MGVAKKQVYLYEIRHFEHHPAHYSTQCQRVDMTLNVSKLFFELLSVCLRFSDMLNSDYCKLESIDFWCLNLL